MGVEIDETWKKLKEAIAIVAEEMCERDRMSKKQNWMNSEILNKMEERRKAKNRKDDGLYTRLKHEIQKLCREAKDKYYEEKCREIEVLDKVHSHLLYQKIKELRPRGSKMLNSIKSKQGKILIDEEEVKERWAEYVEDLYRDDNRGEVDMHDLVYEAEPITRKEIEAVIKQLPKGKAWGNDNIAAELLQGMGGKVWR